MAYQNDFSNWPGSQPKPGLDQTSVGTGLVLAARQPGVVASGDGWLYAFRVARPGAIASLSYILDNHGASSDWTAQAGVYEENGGVYSLTGQSAIVAIVADQTVGTLAFTTPVNLTVGRTYYAALVFAGTIDVDDLGPTVVGLGAPGGNAGAAAIVLASGIAYTFNAAPLPNTMSDVTAASSFPWLDMAFS